MTDGDSATSNGRDSGTGPPPPPAANGRLVDRFARTISYLRISLTDQCNLSCRYCSPTRVAKLEHGQLLTYEELLRVARLAAELGINKVRLTGGEPLVRRKVISFINLLQEIKGLADIRLTTNGVLLAPLAGELLAAGIRKVNISLDTLRPDRFAAITGHDLFHRVWEGIQQALAVGFAKVKLNVVALNGVNDDEFVDFARLTISSPLQVRFIEFMPIGGASVWERDRYVSSDRIRERLAVLGRLEPVAASGMEGPARIFRLAGARGSLGFISPISHHFCDRCNRLRLTAEGKLRSCLLSDQEIDLRQVLRAGASDDRLKETLLAAIAMKPKGHDLVEGEQGNCHGRMSRIGG